jgi:hypothetical protein
MAAAHPLALELAKQKRHARALILGIGSARNIPPFVAAEHTITAIDEIATNVVNLKVSNFARCTALHVRYNALPLPDASFDLLLSTHALQHGTLDDLQAAIIELARIAAPQALVACALASTADARYRHGRFIAPQCYAPVEGDEIGVPHVYVSKRQTELLFEPFFQLQHCEERNVDEVVGSWAHSLPIGFRHVLFTGIRK